MTDTVVLSTDDDVELIPFNYPHPPPSKLRHQKTFLTGHGSYIRYRAASWLKRCDYSSFRPAMQPLMVVLRDVYNNNTEIELCQANETAAGSVSTKGSDPILYESLFHTLTVEYVNVDGNWSSVFGRVNAVQGTYVQQEI